MRPTLIVAIWTVPAMLSCLQTWATNRLAGRHSDFIAICATQLPGWYLWAALTPLLFRLADKAPPQWPIRARTLAIHAASWLGCLALHASVVGATARLFDAPQHPSFWIVWRVAAISWIPSAFLLYCATVGAAAWMHATRRGRTRERARARVEAELNEARVRAELDALRSQLHPHFLFNALNTVAVLIRSGSAAPAERVVTQLGGLLRELLRNSESHEGTLRDEITMLRRYLDIEQIRFGPALRVEWNVPADCLDALVPVLLLQPLVENAIRHGVAKRESGGRVQITAMQDATQLVLSIVNDTPDTRSSDAESNGVGLRNTRRRLDHLYGGLGRLRLSTSEVETVVEVSVPYHVRHSTGAVTGDMVPSGTAPAAHQG